MIVITNTVLIGRAILVTIFTALSGITLLSSFASADAADNGTDYEEDSYDWNVLAGEDLLNDPLAAKILENIEISKQRIAQLENPQIYKTDHEKFVDLQREMSKQRLQEDLDRMNKKYEDFTPRAAFAKYVAKKPAVLHDLYWELFEYMYHKVTFAREARDKILEQGGSYKEAQQVFIQIASITKAERIWKVQQVNEKYGLTNKISSLANFNGLPTETKNAYEEYTKLSFDQKKELYFFGRISENKVSEPQNILGQGGNFETNAFKLGTFQEVSDTQTDIIGSDQGQYFEISTNVLTNQGALEMSSDDVSLQLMGDDYVTKVVDSMDSVSEFTLSAWVKPDYGRGSTEFTVLSKEDAFSLTINNIKWPHKLVRFSVFDGIKWTMIQSTSTIEEEWTHIAATLDGSTISLYINGNIEATTEIEGIPTMNSYGYLEEKTIDNISSDSEIIIGAQESHKRDFKNFLGFFSGMVDEIVILDESLEEQQIFDLCQQSEYYPI